MVTIDLFSFSLLKPLLLPAIGVVSLQLRFCCVCGNDRLRGMNFFSNQKIDVLKLCIAVRMLFAFNRLAIALEAVSHPMQKEPDQTTAGNKSELSQFCRQAFRVLACPA
jgi:hypothetical protein